MSEGSAGDLRECGQKLESLAKLMAVDRFRNHILVVRDDPTHFMGTAETPQDSADGPDISLCTTLRARPNGCTTVERERNHIVWVRSHDPNLITVRPYQTVTRLSGRLLLAIYLCNL